MTDRPADAELIIIDKSIEFIQSGPYPFPALTLFWRDCTTFSGSTDMESIIGVIR